MLTVVMTTRNGGHTLPIVLDAFTRLEPPLGGYRLVVVDGGSSDGSEVIIRAFANRLPITLLHGSGVGKAAAVNRGIAAADGDLVVFIDDDVVPSPDWLRALRGAASRYSDYALFGGAVAPNWPAAPRLRILDHVPLSVTYGITPPALTEGAVSPTLIRGSNLAVRRSALGRFGGFQAHGGDDDEDNNIGWETDFLLRASAAGERAWFVPTAEVHHLIWPHELAAQWIFRRARRFGRAVCRREMAAGYSQKLPLIGGVPVWLTRRFVKELARLISALLKGREAQALEARWEVNFLSGYFAEAVRTRRPDKLP